MLEISLFDGFLISLWSKYFSICMWRGCEHIEFRWKTFPVPMIDFVLYACWILDGLSPRWPQSHARHLSSNYCGSSSPLTVLRAIENSLRKDCAQLASCAECTVPAKTVRLSPAWHTRERQPRSTAIKTLRLHRTGKCVSPTELFQSCRALKSHHATPPELLKFILSIKMAKRPYSSYGSCKVCEEQDQQTYSGVAIERVRLHSNW